MYRVIKLCGSNLTRDKNFVILLPMVSLILLNQNRDEALYFNYRYLDLSL